MGYTGYASEVFTNIYSLKLNRQITHNSNLWQKYYLNLLGSDFENTSMSIRSLQDTQHKQQVRTLQQTITVLSHSALFSNFNLNVPVQFQQLLT